MALTLEGVRGEQDPTMAPVAVNPGPVDLHSPCVEGGQAPRQAAPLVLSLRLRRARGRPHLQQ
jgi:hypothetical protein